MCLSERCICVVRILCLRALFAEQIFDVDGIMARTFFFYKNRGATVCSERGESFSICTYICIPVGNFIQINGFKIL